MYFTVERDGARTLPLRRADCAVDGCIRVSGQRVERLAPGCFDFGIRRTLKAQTLRRLCINERLNCGQGNIANLALEFRYLRARHIVHFDVGAQFAAKYQGLQIVNCGIAFFETVTRTDIAHHGVHGRRANVKRAARQESVEFKCFDCRFIRIAFKLRRSGKFDDTGRHCGVLQDLPQLPRIQG